MSFYNGILNHDEGSGLENIRGARGSPGIGFKLDSNNDYDMQNKKLVNVKNGVNGSDVVTKSQLDTKTSLLDGARTHGYIVDNKAVIYSQSGAVHAKSFYLQDQNEDEVRILTDNQDFDNVHLFVPNLKNFDGFGGRKRSEFMVTSVDQTVSGNKFFQNIKAPNPSEDSDVANKNYVDFEITKQNVLIDNEFVKKSGSLMTGDLILPHYNYPVQGNTNKAISYETQREIFISRKETFPMETSLDMNNNVIENIAEVTSGHEALRKSQLDDALVIVNNDLSDKADKSYVDTKLDTKLNKIITKDINLNNKQLTNLGFNINDPGDVVNLRFTDQKYQQKVSDSDLDMDDQRVTNSLDPVNDKDLTTKKFVTDQITESHITGSNVNNEMTFLKDTSSIANVRGTVINAYEDYINSPHPNLKAYKITINPTSNNLYDAAVKFNISYLAVGKYSIIIEYYPPSMDNVNIIATVNQITIHKQMKREFSTYSKLLLQIENKVKKATNAIILQMTGSSVNPFTAYIIIYGVIEWSDYVSPLVYSIAGGQSSSEIDTSSFVKLDGSRVMTGNLDMNTNNIINVKEPVNDSDAVNKKFFEDQLLQSHLLPSHKDNAFKYLLDLDESSSERNIIVNGIVDFNESPHKNKKAYDIDLIYTQGTQNYDSQIGINIYPLPIGKFTIIMEYYYPQNIGITVSCQATTAIIDKQISKNFSDYIKLLVQFEDQKKATPDYLYFNIRGSGTTSTNPEGILWYDRMVG